MDAGVADTLNRHVVQLITARMDAVDIELGYMTIAPWYRSAVSDTLMGEGPATQADRAWYVGQIAARTPGLDFDGEPADCDWDNLFSHFRAEIMARREPDAEGYAAKRDPKTPPVRDEPPVRDGVGSR